MAFLDNSGDIILDAVLTDTGRYRLAKGDGSFHIRKFALGDDEIDYGLYDRNNPSGSAYYDLQILQTPVLEAFTDNAASLKSKLVSYSATDLLYLPVLKINDLNAPKHSSGAFLIAVDEETEKEIINNNQQGILQGETLGGAMIQVDQGLDTTEITPAVEIDPNLYETQYSIEIDNRLGMIRGNQGLTANVSFIDDDQMATYKVTINDEFVVKNTTKDEGATEVIAGPRGTSLMFRIGSSLELNTSDFLFERLGSQTTVESVPVYKIDTFLRITGLTTGVRIDIPLRFVKLV